jgi:hypothetical protein
MLVSNTNKTQIQHGSPIDATVSFGKGTKHSTPNSDSISGQQETDEGTYG